MQLNIAASYRRMEDVKARDAEVDVMQDDKDRHWIKKYSCRKLEFYDAHTFQSII